MSPFPLLLEISRKVDELFNAVMKGQTSMALDLTALKQQVAETKQVEASALALIQGIANQLKAMADTTVDPNQLKAMAADLHSSSVALAAAVAQNTPAAPPASPPPAATP